MITNFFIEIFYFSAMAAKEKPPINVVGDVGGRIAIVVVSSCILFRCALLLGNVMKTYLLHVAVYKL